MTQANNLDRFLADTEQRAYRLAYVATGQREEALDIVQDAMLKLCRNYAARPHAEWGPLFHRILQSTIRDWYRRQKLRNFFGLSQATDDDMLQQAHDAAAVEQQNTGPEHHIQQERTLTVLDAALHNLPLRQQQAFLLRAWECLDVAQTATAMQCSAGSVKTHYSRAVHSLRQQLEGYAL